MAEWNRKNARENGQPFPLDAVTQAALLQSLTEEIGDTRLAQFFLEERQLLERIQAPGQFQHILLKEAALAVAAGKGGFSSSADPPAAATTVAKPPEQEAKPALAVIQGGQPALAKAEKKHRRYRKRSRLPIFVAVSAAAVLLVVAVQLIANIGELPAPFRGLVEIKAANAQGYQISKDEGFIITATEPLDQELVAESLNIYPEFEYELLEKDNGLTYEVIPVEPLATNTLYRVSFDPERTAASLPVRAENTWAFQTEVEFSVINSLPDDYSTYVPVNTAIQLSFSHEVSLEELQAKISIEPQITGEWQLKNRQLTIIPSEPLAYDEVYSVEVAAELANQAVESLGEPFRFRFATEPQPEADNSNLEINIDHNEAAFSSTEAPYFPIYAYNRADRNHSDPGEITVQVYSFANGADFAAAIQQQANYYYWRPGKALALDTANLTLHSEFAATAEPEADSSHSYRLAFPEPLAKGQYLAVFNLAGQTKQALFQVSDIATYVLEGSQDAIFWTHQAQSGAALAALSVRELESVNQGQTDADGIAVLSLSKPLEQEESHRRIYELQSSDDLLYLAPNNYNVQYSRNQDTQFFDNYWHYFYCDRALYRPGDTVNYFGVVIPRQQEVTPATDLRLVLSGGIYDFSQSEIVTEVTLDANQVFSGAYQLPYLESGWYSLTLYQGELYVDSFYFEVADYQKAAYTFAIDTDQEIVMVGDQLAVTVRAKYFEDTPLVGLPVQLVIGNRYAEEGEQQILDGITDEQGEAQFQITVPTSYDTFALDYTGLTARSSAPEVGDTSTYRGLPTLNYNFHLEGQAERDNEDGFSLELLPFTLDPAQADLNTVDDYALELSTRQPFQGEQQAELQIIRNERVDVTENEYNEYTGLTETVTRTVTQEVVENTVPLSFQGSEALVYEGVLESDWSYDFIVSGTDSEGNPFKRSFYVSAKQEVASYSDHYWLLDSNRQTDDTATAMQRRGNYGYQVGEEVRMQFYSGRSGGPAEMQAGEKILFLRSTDKLYDYHLSTENEFRFAYSEDFLANVNLVAIYFSEGKYYGTTQQVLTYDVDQKRAQVEIQTDREQYQPGDTVTLDISLRDPDGQPIQGVVNINMIDEALWKLRANDTDFTARLFQNYYSFDYVAVSSHPSLDGYSPGGAEGGEGPGDGYREHFEDVAIAATLQTDTQGQAQLEITLPDNITAWRVVWHGLAPEPLAVNSGSFLINASLEFFVEARVASAYLIGDQPSVGLRAAGTALDYQQQVNYQLSIEELDFETEVTQTGSGWLEIALPELTEAGDYTLRLQGSQGALRDGIELPFQVRESFASHHQLSTVDLAEAGALQGSEQYPTTFIFSNHDQALALESLYQLANQEDIRLEQRLASLYARQLLSERFDQQEWALDQTELAQTVKDLRNYQTDDYGLAKLPYAESSLRLSAMAAATCADYLDQAALNVYFRNYFASEESTVNAQALALWGLAALGEPVLADIAVLLTEAEISAETQLYLTMAVYQAGYGREARALAESLIGKYSEDLGGQYRAKIDGLDSETLDDATALLAMLANIFDLPEADGYLRYLQDNPQSHDYYLLEKLAILEARLERLSEAASFSYRLHGESAQVDLSEQLFAAFSLLPEEIDALEITAQQGDISLSTLTLCEGLPEVADPLDEGLSLTRSYQGDSGKTADLEATEIQTITLDYSIAAEAPAGYYQIVDYLPAGLSFSEWLPAEAAETADAAPQAYFLKQDGQKLIFCVTHPADADTATTGSIRYTARVNSPGLYRAGNAYLSHQENQRVFLLLPEQQVSIH